MQLAKLKAEIRATELIWLCSHC